MPSVRRRRPARSVGQGLLRRDTRSGARDSFFPLPRHHRPRQRPVRVAAGQPHHHARVMALGEDLLRTERARRSDMYRSATWRASNLLPSARRSRRVQAAPTARGYSRDHGPQRHHRTARIAQGRSGVWGGVELGRRVLTGPSAPPGHMFTSKRDQAARPGSQAGTFPFTTPRAHRRAFVKW